MSNIDIDYFYNLPEERIAQNPIEPRSAARLLDATATSGQLIHRKIKDLPSLIRVGDVIVVNETKVNKSRIFLKKKTGARIEVLLLEKVEGISYQFEALIRPLNKCPSGTELFALDGDGQHVITVLERKAGSSTAFVEILDEDYVLKCGKLALPPYIKIDLDDENRYQTIYASKPGSVAAPTAGLHITKDVLDECKANGAEILKVDLSVGIDTFRPIKVENPEDHVMHTERYSVPGEVIEKCKSANRVISIGTTTLRALESAANGKLSGRTDLFIYGNYDFKVVDLLLTNFHIPKSTLLLMIDAFCGKRWRDIYQSALENDYRFLSFGDAMIVARYS